MSCDDRGVEVVEQEADFTRQDLHFRSIALERLSSAEPCGFGAGRALDLLQAFFWGAPVLRVRISYLRYQLPATSQGQAAATHSPPD